MCTVFCLRVYVYTTHVPGALKGQARESDAQKLELQVAVSPPPECLESNVGLLEKQPVRVVN